MTNVITDTLLSTLADIHARADVSLDLDSAMNVLELADAQLKHASPAEKQHIEERARELSKQANDPELTEFFQALIENMNASD
jgi:hypothetical protein